VYVRAGCVYVRLGAAGFGFTVRTWGAYGSGGGASDVVVVGGGVVSASADPAPDQTTATPIPHTTNAFPMRSQRPKRAPASWRLPHR